MSKAKVSTEEINWIIHSYNNLVPVIQMATILNVSRMAVYKILKKCGVNTSKRKIEVTCTYCDSILIRTKGRIRKSNHSFCGSECYFSWLRKGLGIGPDIGPYIPRDSIYYFAMLREKQGTHTIIPSKNMSRKVVSVFFKLKKGNVVHHKDRNGLNNHPHNLMVFINNGDHVRYHRGHEVKCLWDGAKDIKNQKIMNEIIKNMYTVQLWDDLKYTEYKIES